MPFHQILKDGSGCKSFENNMSEGTLPPAAGRREQHPCQICRAAQCISVAPAPPFAAAGTRGAMHRGVGRTCRSTPWWPCGYFSHRNLFFSGPTPAMNFSCKLSTSAFLRQSAVFLHGPNHHYAKERANAVAWRNRRGGSTGTSSAPSLGEIASL